MIPTLCLSYNIYAHTRIEGRSDEAHRSAGVRLLVRRGAPLSIYTIWGVEGPYIMIKMVDLMQAVENFMTNCLSCLLKGKRVHNPNGNIST